MRLPVTYESDSGIAFVFHSLSSRDKHMFPPTSKQPSTDGRSGVCVCVLFRPGLCASSAAHFALWELFFPHYIGHHTGVDRLWGVWCNIFALSLLLKGFATGFVF